MKTADTIRRIIGNDRPIQIPAGVTYDLVDYLGKVVTLHSIDGIRVKLDLRNAELEQQHFHDIVGACATVDHMSTSKQLRNVRCERYFTVWESIDPNRASMFWNFRGDLDGARRAPGHYIIVNVQE